MGTATTEKTEDVRIREEAVQRLHKIPQRSRQLADNLSSSEQATLLSGCAHSAKGRIARSHGATLVVLDQAIECLHIKQELNRV